LKLEKWIGILTTPSQNPDFSKGVNISTGSTRSYSSITGAAAPRKQIKTPYHIIGKNEG
jgi:hypothetical protein